MQIKHAEFVKSSSRLEECPSADKSEFAFIGRSNVGKSSLINCLTNKKSLAKTSSTPGKTQLINHFIINDSWYLVDLPGYGYAKAGKKERLKWSKFTNDYILNRNNLLGVFVLIDSRLDAQKIDLEFMEWLAVNAIPFVMVFTKTDKLSSSALIKKLKKYQQVMLNKGWEEMPMSFQTSSTNQTGKEEILRFIEQVIQSTDTTTI